MHRTCIIRVYYKSNASNSSRETVPSLYSFITFCNGMPLVVMNIFVTDPSPYLCATHLDDKRLVKMCLETAQMLSTVLRMLGYEYAELYRPTHVHHPCVLWARSSITNLLWLRDHHEYLLLEYYARYQKVHASQGVLTMMQSLYWWQRDTQPISFANCARNTQLGFDFTHLSIHDAYKAYLCARWDTDKITPKWSSLYGRPFWYSPTIRAIGSS